MAFTLLKQLKDTANSSISYYIILGKLYRVHGIFEVDEYEQWVSMLLPNCHEQTVKGYVNLIWFTKQVYKYPSETIVKVTLLHFL